MASLTWGIAGAVAAFSAILLTPTQGVQSIDSLGPELLLRGLAGAVIARMASLPIAFAVSLGVGVLEQILLSRQTAGFVDVVLGAAILIALLRQRQAGRRGEETPAWRRPSAGVADPWARIGLGLLVTVGITLAYVVSNATASVLTEVCGFALVGLSVILVTGVAGELSLGQFAFAGIAAAVSVRVASSTGNMFLGVVAGCAAGAVSAALVGLPALRLRGVALGVTTLAFALATSGWLLRQPWLLGDGLDTPYPVWHGYVVSVAADYYLFALMLLAIGWWVTSRLRNGGFGRLLLALRDNEEAGRALTIAAPMRKLQAYAVCGALAGLGGVVIGFSQSQLSVNSFPASASIDAVAIAVVGGMARNSGALLGSAVIVGLPALVPLGIPGQAALTLGWLLVVLLLPDGLGGLLATLRQRIPLHLPRAGRGGPGEPASPPGPPSTQPPTAALAEAPDTEALDAEAAFAAFMAGNGRASAGVAADGGITAAATAASSLGTASTFDPGPDPGPGPGADGGGVGDGGATSVLKEEADGDSPALTGSGFGDSGGGRARGWGSGQLPARPLVLDRDGRPLLQVVGVRRAFGGVRAVDEATFAVAEGEIVGIIGPNGAGKTTLFEILAGFTSAHGGAVYYRGRAVTRWAPERRARHGLVRSFQDARLFPAMTVREAVMVAAEAGSPARIAADVLGHAAAEAGKAARADRALRTMGLDEHAERAVGELSTGTRRIVELCCLLTLEPRLMLLDEPSSGLTQADGAALGDLLLRVRAELGTTVLVIEHDLPLLSRVADRLIAMDAGRVIADGTPDEVRAHPAVVLSYLGTDEAAVARSGMPAG
ncbi:ATP-binding cassette domain-containing protein [Paractinoplanes durhamensis]